MMEDKFDLIEEVLCGVNPTPQRVAEARESLKGIYHEFNSYASNFKSVRKTLERINCKTADAGVRFYWGHDKDGHAELSSIIELVYLTIRLLKAYED